MLQTITWLDKIAALHGMFFKKGMLVSTTAAYIAQLLSEMDSNAAGDGEHRVTEEGEDEDEEQGEDYGKVGAQVFEGHRTHSWATGPVFYHAHTNPR